MLKIFLCTDCQTYRIVSKSIHRICPSCGVNMNRCNISYTEYSNMNDNQRKEAMALYMKRKQKSSNKGEQSLI